MFVDSITSMSSIWTTIFSISTDLVEPVAFVYFQDIVKQLVTTYTQFYVLDIYFKIILAHLFLRPVVRALELIQEAQLSILRVLCHSRDVDLDLLF